MIRISDEMATKIIEGHEISQAERTKLLNQMISPNHNRDVLDSFARLLMMPEAKKSIGSNLLASMRNLLLTPSEFATTNALMKKRGTCSGCGKEMIGGEMSTIDQDQGVRCGACETATYISCGGCGTTGIELTNTQRRYLEKMRKSVSACPRCADQTPNRRIEETEPQVIPRTRAPQVGNIQAAYQAGMAQAENEFWTAATQAPQIIRDRGLMAADERVRRAGEWTMIGTQATTVNTNPAPVPHIFDELMEERIFNTTEEP